MLSIKHLVSSCIDSATYDSKTQEMTLTFGSGSVYRYFGVEEDAFVRLINAPSVGHEFQCNIRDAYPYAREG